MNVLDLFSGIGGFSLGLERAGFVTKAFCESDPYCQRVLAHHWPDVPIHSDIRELDGEQYRGTVDVVCGGWPCQTYSRAARGRNTHPDMLPDFLRIVREVRPRWVIAENVAAVDVCAVGNGFGATGYAVRTYGFTIPFRNHIRDRFFFVANANGKSESRRTIYEEVARLCAVSGCGGEALPLPVGMDDGVPRRMDRLRALGNAVVPQIPEIIGRAIMQAEQGV